MKESFFHSVQTGLASLLMNFDVVLFVIWGVLARPAVKYVTGVEGPSLSLKSPFSLD